MSSEEIFGNALQSLQCLHEVMQVKYGNQKRKPDVVMGISKSIKAIEYFRNVDASGGKVKRERHSKADKLPESSEESGD